MISQYQQNKAPEICKEVHLSLWLNTNLYIFIRWEFIRLGKEWRKNTKKL